MGSLRPAAVCALACALASGAPVRGVQTEPALAEPIAKPVDANSAESMQRLLKDLANPGAQGNQVPPNWRSFGLVGATYYVVPLAQKQAAIKPTVAAPGLGTTITLPEATK